MTERCGGFFVCFFLMCLCVRVCVFFFPSGEKFKVDSSLQKRILKRKKYC